ncbi:MAG: hypothetical protein ACWGHH_05695 [Sulfurovaceae bacterium]
MAILEKGFEMKYSVYSIRSVKVVEGGNFQGKDGTVKYGSSLKLRTLNIEQFEDDSLGLIDKEIIVEFNVPAPDTTPADLKKFNIWARSLDLKNKPLLISGALPKSTGKDTYEVKSFLNVAEIMTLNGFIKEATK